MSDNSNRYRPFEQVNGAVVNDLMDELAAEKAAREKAEAKLAELEKQEPVAHVRDLALEKFNELVHANGPWAGPFKGGDALYASPKPPADVAELQKRAELEAEKNGLVQSIINMQQAGAELECKLAEYQAAILRYENVGQDDLLKPEEELATLLSAEREAGRKEAVPDGRQVVPIEPTPEMTDHLTGPGGYTSIPLADAWKAMLAAAPTPEKEE